MKIFDFLRQWNLSLLQSFLSVRDQQAIEDTPLGDLSRKDQLVWDYSKNGTYSIKSGYRWIQSRSIVLRDTRQSDACVVPKALWKVIWKLEVPPKLRHFLWLTMHNCLPTCAVLFRRRSSLSPACPICRCHDKSIEHLFLQCSWVEPIWFGGALNYKVDCSALPSWVVWLQVPINPSKVLFVVFSALGSFLVERTVLGSCRSDGIGRAGQVFWWCSPASPNIKINVDASWSKVFKLGFAGVIMRDEDGRFVAASRYFLKASSAIAAEAIALLRGCELGAALGVTSVIIEYDYLDAVKCLSCSLDMGS
ncbi:uncharacterized protein LOC125471485 [Pyrus x bretschneideri]|uniref:uncharacterized protein LOC125471485 n=1 Tax=Pyrus x bretschneideri TaxID=225117 RepID=UPI00202FAD97|nr:uncharacterized protein LOC125471485 [Pyrus x bretschneideri]